MSRKTTPTRRAIVTVAAWTIGFLIFFPILWAILGAGVRANDAAMREALLAQDCLSTVIELDPARNTHRLADGDLHPACPRP